MTLARIVVVVIGLALAGCATPRTPSGVHARLPGELWIDLVQGDEVSDEEVITDLAKAGVIYLGEYHSISRHHEVQLRVMQELFSRRVPLVLGLEQLETPDQPALDRYGRREIDFAALVTEVQWEKKWRNYAAYRPLCEFARQHRIPIRALNGPADLIRAVYRGGGVQKLPPAQRAQLPAAMQLDDPAYEQLLKLEMGVHAGMDAAKLRPMFEAQVARDEVMAAQIVAARKSGSGAPRTALVILGAGHMRYGLGTASRVRRLEPGIVERLVLMSESGQLQLSAAEKSGAQQVDIRHEDFRNVGRPPADYLRLLPKAAVTLPPGHPPVNGP
jgi:uncharacterized iron-regulated protein